MPEDRVEEEIGDIVPPEETAGDGDVGGIAEDACEPELEVEAGEVEASEDDANAAEPAAEETGDSADAAADGGEPGEDAATAPEDEAEEGSGDAASEEGDADGEDGEDSEDEDASSDAPAFPLTSIVEAVLFAAREPLKAQQIARAVGKRTRQEAVREAIDELNVHYLETGRAFEVADISGRYQLMSRPEYVNHIMKIYPKKELTEKDKSTRLTPAALDTLSIIAYKQPVTRGEIEHIRGVGCGPVLRALIERGSVKVAGKRMDLVGQPLMYGTTEAFLAEFGLGSIEELPLRNEFLGMLGETPGIVSEDAEEETGTAGEEGESESENESAAVLSVVEIESEEDVAEDDVDADVEDDEGDAGDDELLDDEDSEDDEVGEDDDEDSDEFSDDEESEGDVEDLDDEVDDPEDDGNDDDDDEFSEDEEFDDDDESSAKEDDREL